MSRMDARWPNGPWDTEPDLAEWVCAGLQCSVRRDPTMGFLCGYVGLPAGHPWETSDEIETEDEITYGCTHKQRAVVEHPTATPEFAPASWVGIDFAHAGDMIPFDPRDSESLVYRDFAYARARVERLAAQARRELDHEG